MSRSGKQRKVRIIESDVQLGLARRIMLHWVAFMVVGSVIAAALQVMSDPLRPFSEHLSLLIYSLGPFVLAMLAILPVFIADTIKFSLRFAGPVFRMRQLLHDMSQGKVVRPLQTRKGDFWQTTVEELNTLIARQNQLASEKQEVGA